MWPVARVSELIERGVLTIGDGYRAKNSELGRQGIPFVRAGDIGHGIHLDRADRLLTERVTYAKGKTSRAHDVVFTSKGTVGRIARVPEDVAEFVYSPQLCFWRVLDPDVLDPDFLYYWLASAEGQSQLASFKDQTDMAPYISLRDQRLMSVPIPPATLQRKVAAALGALDAKIDLNRRLGEVLDKLASALLARAIAGSTKTDRLDSLIELNPQRVLAHGSPAPYVDMQALPTKGSSVANVSRRPFRSGSRFINGDTLLARITPCLENGKTAFVDFLGSETGGGSTEFIVMRPKAPLPEEFAYLLARSDQFRSHAISSMTGSSGRQRVPVDGIAGYPTPVLTEESASDLKQAVRPLFELVRADKAESDALVQLRDALLPELISGRMTVN
jgi:type I restriction enzyme, S subunit